MILKISCLLALMMIFYSACSPGPAASTQALTQALSAFSTETPVQNTSTALPTPTLAPTETIAPTATTVPSPTITPTPLPTNTPKPTATHTPTPAPLVLKGTGADVVDVLWSGVGLAHIVYKGSRNFIVENFDAAGDHIDLLVNTIGAYEGTHLLNYIKGEVTTRFEITASGPWQITISPLNSIRHVSIPGKITGKGDDVVAVFSGKPDTLKVEHLGKNNFFVYAIGARQKLLINEIGTYNGRVILPADTVTVIIGADGAWTLEFE